MKPSTRIILNTLATYGRSVLSIVLTLFSARWVLAALGQTDFGLYGVVGSLILLINVLNGGMSVGVARFYAFSIGEGHHLSDEEAIENQKRWFNTALSIYLALPILFIILGWPIGEYAINHWLTIPAERVHASLWVFRIAMITTCVSLLSVPYTAMYNAHQYISELAFFGVLQSLGMLGLAWCLFYVKTDRLIAYALFVMTLNVGIKIAQIIRATSKFKACRIRTEYMLDRSYLSRLFNYVGWKTLGIGCVVLRGQGIPILVNLYFGPLINASYSISNRLSTQALSLSAAMIQAFQPALVSAEGKGDRNAMLKMAMQVCKFGSLLVLLFAIPLIIEIDALLVLWLESPPEYAGALCHAHGKIARYELIQGTLLFSALPVTWLLFALGLGPASLGYALFGTMVLYCIGRLVFAGTLVQMPLSIWVRQVALPLLLLVSASAAAGLLIRHLYPEGFARICITTATCGLATASLGWTLLLDVDERRYVRQALARIHARITRAERTMNSTRT